MAKLPSEADVGPIQFEARKPTATFDVAGPVARAGAAIGAGQEALGKGMAGLGNAAIEYGKEQQREADKLWLLSANSRTAVAKINLDTQYSDDVEHDTLPQRYSSDLTSTVREIRSTAPNARMQAMYDAHVSDDVARSIARQTAVAKKGLDDKTLAESNTILGAYQEKFVKAADEFERTKITQDAIGENEKLRLRGIIGYEDARKRDVNWAEGAGKNTLYALSPEERQVALRGFEGSLIHRESSNNPRLVNDLGYAGLYQFGAPRLSTLGYYKPGAGEDVNAKGKPGGWDGDKWSGTFNIPGHPEVRSVQDFLNSPDAQKIAFRGHTARMDQEIQKNGFDKYIGTQVQGIPITQDGLRAMLHLGGVGGTRAALDGNSPADKNGTRVIDYARLGVHSDLSRLAARLPSSDLLQMSMETDRAVERNSVQASSEAHDRITRSLIEAKAGNVPLMDRSVIEADPSLKPSHKNQLLSAWDGAAGDIQTFNNLNTEFQNSSGLPFDPNSKQHREFADAKYQALGGGPAALQQVIGRTKIIPPSVASTLRNDIQFGDAKKVGAALSMTTNILNNEEARQNGNIFDSVSAGKEDLSTSTIVFRQLVEGRGMTNEQAAAEIIRRRGVEYKTNVQAKIKNSGVEDQIKRLEPSDLAKAFQSTNLPIPNSVAFWTRPQVGESANAKQQMFSEYKELVKDHFLDGPASGDLDSAKAAAAKDLALVWGATTIGGELHLMKWAPGNSPAYRAIDPTKRDALFFKQVKDAVAERDVLPGGNPDEKRQAIEALKPEDIRVIPMPLTATYYKAGSPPPYWVQVKDPRTGVFQVLNPGQPFYADPKIMAEDSAAPVINAPYADESRRRHAMQKASRKAMVGEDTSAEIAASRPQPKSSEPWFNPVPADLPEARGLPGGGSALSKNVEGVIDTIKRQPVLPKF